jgi:tetraacyldisaccharide 4'-kinase
VSPSRLRGGLPSRSTLHQSADVHRSLGAKLQRWIHRPQPARLAQALSVPVGAFYARRLRGRNAEPPTVPTVVVGDLGFGGAGKTAVVAHLARALARRRRVAIVGHGYGGCVRAPERVTATDVQRYGDEASALFRALGQSCAIWVGRDRSQTSASAGRDADVVIIDRGLGDPRLSRTVDVVVVDGGASTQVFPAGPLRAPISAASSAALRWINHSPVGADPPAGSVCSRYRVDAVELPGGRRVDPTWLAGRHVVTLCGVAKPDSFYDALIDAGAHLAGGLEVADHRYFSPRALERLPRERPWVTTAKDRERLPARFPVTVVHAALEIVAGHGLLDALYHQLEGP